MEATILKKSAKRTVRLEMGRDGSASCVIKHFHAGGLLGRWSNRRRAHGEFDLLEFLRARGVAVPEPLWIRKARERGWEVCMQFVEHVGTLDDLLGERAPWPVPPGHVAAALGQLLAGLQDAGVHHGDLHASNVLVDKKGQPFLLDFHQARRKSQLSARECLDELEAVAARGRESTEPGFRARFFVAWRKALEHGARRGVDETGLHELVEQRARERRRKVVARDRRWAKERVFEAVEGGRLRLAPEASPATARRAVRAWAAFPGADGTGELLQLGVLALEHQGLIPAVQSFTRVGHMWQHKLGFPRPLALFQPAESERTIAFFEGPGQLERVGVYRPQAAPPDALGRFLGELHDRGFGLEIGEANMREWYLHSATGRLMAGPGLVLPTRGARELDVIRRIASDMDGEEPRAAFVRAFVAAHRTGRPEHRRLTAELRESL